MGKIYEMVVNLNRFWELATSGVLFGRGKSTPVAVGVRMGVAVCVLAGWARMLGGPVVTVSDTIGMVSPPSDT